MRSSAMLASVLDNARDVVTISTALAAFIALIVSRLALAEIMALTHVRKRSGTNRPSRGFGKIRKGIRARLSGEPWTVADEYGVLEADVTTDAWGQNKYLWNLAESYDNAGAALRRSLLIRLGAGTDAAADEARFCDETAEALRHDAAHSPYGRLSDAGHDRLARLLEANRVRVLAWPPKGTLSASYRDIRCSLTGEQFGAPDMPFSVLAKSEEPGRWPGVADSTRAALDRTVVRVAEERVANKPEDFNGSLLRLRDWRAESSERGLGFRLHLLGDRTNYATSLATSGGFRLLRDDPDWRGLVEPLCLDCFTHPTLEPAEPSRSGTANNLAVHLTLITADRRLVLAQRSESVERGPGRLNTAVNGALEIAPRFGLGAGDFDPRGFVDPAEAALREAEEEIGAHLGLTRDDLVTRALGLVINHEEEVTPFLCFEARTALTLEEVAAGHFAGASRHEGVFELGEQLIGLPHNPHRAQGAVAWIHKVRAQLTDACVLTTLLAYGYFLTADEIVDAWETASPVSEDVVERTRL